MIEFRPKIWRSLGAAVALASAGALAGCGGESGEAGPGEAGGEAGAYGEAGEAAIGETGQEGGAPPASGAVGEAGGEAGVATAYGRLSADQRRALRLQHIKGFLLVAQKELEQGRQEEAGILIAQGVLEAHDPAPTDVAGLDVARINAAATALQDKTPDAKTKFDAALAAIDSQQTGPLPLETARRMLRIASGIYQEAVTAEGVNTIEYAHALGAVLAAQDALARAQTPSGAAGQARLQEARAEMDTLVGMFPNLTGDQAKPAPQVLAQASRIELALSGL